MAPSRDPIELPASYADLPFEQIRIANYPASSKTVTPIVVVTLYRPGKHNAFTPTIMTELEKAFAMFDVDDRVRCIVVTGHGKIFCAGADLELGFIGGRERIPDHRDGYVCSFTPKNEYQNETRNALVTCLTISRCTLP